MEKYLRPRWWSLSMLLVVLVFSIVAPAGAETLFTWPINGKVITEYKDSGYEAGGHRGIDIEAQIGQSVVAAADGRVLWVGKTPSGELCVSIEHDGGKRTTYMPVSLGVKEGQAVKQGNIIGTTLSGGQSSSIPHLHFGVKVSPYGSQDYINPLMLLPPLAAQPQKPSSSSPSPGPAGKSAPSSPAPGPAQVPAKAGSGAPSVAAADSIVAPSIVPSDSSVTAVSTAESASAQVGQPTESSTIRSAGKLSPGVSSASQILSQGTMIKSKPDLDELLSPALPKATSADMAARNLRQRRATVSGTAEYSNAETRTSPWETALLSLTLLLALFCAFKKKILSFVSSRPRLKLAFARSTY